MDLYRLLGVDRNATPQEIKKAFREKAKKYHPDINPEYSEYFKQITHAYDILIDPEKRRRYDISLGKLEKKDFSRIIGDILSEFLGFHTKPVNGEDIKVKVRLSVEEAYHGSIKQIRYKRKVTCTTCGGNGITAESSLVECDRCRGTGRVKKAFIEIPCITCFGRGFKIINPCPICRGNGRTYKFETKKIQIPGGVIDRQEVVLESGGNDGINGGNPGNLIIKVHIKDGKYRLKKLDLFTELKVKKETLKEAGGISVRDIDGNIITIPVEETDRPVRFRIKNRGYRTSDGKRGDLIVKLIPV
ncbi:DnaJ domain-containing protein [Persephonella sp.]